MQGRDEFSKSSVFTKFRFWNKKGYIKSLKNMVKKKKFKKNAAELLTLDKTLKMMLKKTIVKHEDYKDWLIKVWENVHTHNRQVQAGYDSIMTEAIINLRRKSSRLVQHSHPKECTDVPLKNLEEYNAAMKYMDQEIKDKTDKLFKIQKVNQYYIDFHENLFADFVETLENAKGMCIRFNGILRNLSDEA